MTKYLIAGLALASCASTLNAMPCKDYEATAFQTGALTYNPAEDVIVPVSIQLERIGKDIDRSCTSVPVEITDQAGLRIELRNGATVLEARFIRSSDFEQPSDNLVRLTGKARRDLVENGRIAIDLLSVAPGQFVPPGEYASNLSLLVGSGPPTTFRVSIIVEPTIKLLTGGVTKQLSLGDISGGSRVTSDFLYRTNSSVLVTAQSVNGGALVHEAGENFGRVKYEVRLNGYLLDLVGQAVTQLPLRSLDRQTGRLEVNVPPQPPLFGGHYRDTLTITFVAN